MMAPYLKDVHQTIASWREDRNKDGWRLSLREMLSISINELYDTAPLEGNALTRVKMVTWLTSDLFALQKLLESTTPR